jgi:hypothetical protein
VKEEEGTLEKLSVSRESGWMRDRGLLDWGGKEDLVE